MQGRGGIGLGLAEPELSVQYVVAGGAASEHAGFFEVGRNITAHSHTDTVPAQMMALTSALQHFVATRSYQHTPVNCARQESSTEKAARVRSSVG